MGTCEKKTVTALPQRKIRGKDPQDGSLNSLLNRLICATKWITPVPKAWAARGSGGILPQINFDVLKLWNSIFSVLRRLSLKCMLIIDCHFYVEIYFACLHVQLFNFILYFVQFFVAYWSGLVQSHSSKCNENATPLQSIQLWKCNPIQQHIRISLLLGSNPPPVSLTVCLSSSSDAMRPH